MYIIEEKQVRFFWDSDKVFDLVALRSGYSARGVMSSDGSNEVGELTAMVTIDDKEFFVELLREAMFWLYSKFSDMTVCRLDSFSVHQPSVPLGVFVSGFWTEVSTNDVGELIVDSSKLDTISAVAQELLSYKITLKWAEINRMDKLSSSLVSEMADAETRFNRLLYPFKQKFYKSSFVKES